jgi:hypothetical protein
MNDDAKFCLTVLGAIVGLPILGGIIANIVDNRHEEKMAKYVYENRDERIEKLQKNGAHVNINLDGEI